MIRDLPVKEGRRSMDWWRNGIETFCSLSWMSASGIRCQSKSTSWHSWVHISLYRQGVKRLESWAAMSHRPRDQLPRQLILVFLQGHLVIGEEQVSRLPLKDAQWALHLHHQDSEAGVKRKQQMSNKTVNLCMLHVWELFFNFL